MGAPLLVVLALVAPAAACSGDDGQTAEERAQQAVCDDADALQRAGEKLLDEVRSGNLGDAADQLSTVESAFNALADSVEKLATEKQQTVQRQLTEVQETLSGLLSLENLADIGDALDTAEAQLEGVVNTVTDSLSCE